MISVRQVLLIPPAPRTGTRYKSCRNAPLGRRGPSPGRRPRHGRRARERRTGAPRARRTARRAQDQLRTERQVRANRHPAGPPAPEAAHGEGDDPVRFEAGLRGGGGQARLASDEDQRRPTDERLTPRRGEHRSEGRGGRVRDGHRPSGGGRGGDAAALRAEDLLGRALEQLARRYQPAASAPETSDRGELDPRGPGRGDPGGGGPRGGEGDRRGQERKDARRARGAHRAGRGPERRGLPPARSADPIAQCGDRPAAAAARGPLAARTADGGCAHGAKAVNAHPHIGALGPARAPPSPGECARPAGGAQRPAPRPPRPPRAARGPPPADGR